MQTAFDLGFTAGILTTDSVLSKRKCDVGPDMNICLQNVPPALLIRFLREHRSEWADCDIDVDAAAALRTSNFVGSESRGGICNGQLPLPLAHAVEQEEVC